MKELLELYWTFVRIGLVTFGGGYAMLPILERELAEEHMVDHQMFENDSPVRKY